MNADRGGTQRMPSGQAAKTRTRNGCERCRARRRKCDEARPRCNRCIDAGAECHYLTSISFLEKNSHTLYRQLVPATSLNSGREVQFMNDSLSFQKPQSKLADSELSTPSNRPPEEKNASESRTTEAGEGWSKHIPLTHENPQQPSISDRSAKLLANYIGRVAPWLDILDPSQTFGLLVPHLAMASQPVLQEILELAAATSNMMFEDGFLLDESRAITRGALLPTTDATFTALQAVLTFNLHRAQSFFWTDPASWDAVFVAGSGPISFAQVEPSEWEHKRIWLSGVTLMLRLELAYSLFNELAPSVGSEFLTDVLAQFEKGTEQDSLDAEFKASLECLVLLVDVTTLCLTPTKESDRVEKDASYDESWNRLLARLQSWHSHRPQHLLPLSEIKSSTGSMHLLLFTNSTSFATIMFYHTAMLILLGKSPSPQAPGQPGMDSLDNMGVQASPIWHAQSVCGIATGKHQQLMICWDPCTISCFIIAARKIADTEMDFSVCVENIKAAGWRINDLQRSLL